MSNVISYVVESEDQLPRHLKDRSPYRKGRTDMMLRAKRDEAIAEDGRVLMAGAIEFQTQITPNQLADVCDPAELYNRDLIQTSRFRSVYDPEIQRGEKEGRGGTRVEFLKEKQVEEMMEDIRQNRFDCPPLMWNLRAGETLWAYVESTRELLIFQGVATRPDTNHRHHAIIRLHNHYRRWMAETDSEVMEEYNPQRPYSLLIYTDDFEGEARKFFVLNTKGWDVPASKAHYIISRTSTPHAHAKLARELMEECGTLTAKNVELVQSVLSKNSAKMVLFYTLVRGLEAAFPAVPSEAADYEALKAYLIEYVAELGRVRPREIGLLSLQNRQLVRTNTLADQAIMWIAYLRLAAWLRENAGESWRTALAKLGDEFTYQPEGRPPYVGDLMSRQNPLWRDRGILSLTDKGALRVISNRNAQEQVFLVLRDCVETGLADRAEPIAA